MGSLQSTSRQPTGAVVVFDTNKIKGVVEFEQKSENVHVKVDIKGLKKNHNHGFHIHEHGDLREGSKSCCAHYNPLKMQHGGLEDIESHSGDLGNIHGNNQGECKISFKTSKFTVKEIIGRSLIIHADEDDLGLGGMEDSKTTGHSGERIACAIIGICKEE